MKTMKDYHELYLKCDLLLLVDVFEKNRKNSLNTPALRKDAMLNITKVEIEAYFRCWLIYSFKKVMTGEVSYISKRYGKANNKHLKSYDQKKA